ncbi:unnamed protein product, partial [Allacma fusca]
KALLAIV